MKDKFKVGDRVVVLAGMLCGGSGVVTEVLDSLYLIFVSLDGSRVGAWFYNNELRLDVETTLIDLVDGL